LGLLQQILDELQDKSKNTWINGKTFFYIRSKIDEDLIKPLLEEDLRDDYYILWEELSNMDANLIFVSKVQSEILIINEETLTIAWYKFNSPGCYQTAIGLLEVGNWRV
jgi:hypothetical protein